MGCNCGKDKIELTIRKKVRRMVKEKIADVKKLWEESKNNPNSVIVTTNKKDLNFK